MKYFKFKNPDGSFGYCRGDAYDRIKSDPTLKEIKEISINDFAIAAAVGSVRNEEECLALLQKDELEHSDKGKTEDPRKK